MIHIEREVQELFEKNNPPGEDGKKVEPSKYLLEVARDLESDADDFIRSYAKLDDKMREFKLNINDLKELKNEISRTIR